MNGKSGSLAAVALLALFVLQLAACGSTPATRFYSLASLAETGTGEPAPAVSPRKVVGIGPIAIPKYLDHPGITTRSGATTLDRAELDRWGGSLEDETSRVLVENLGRLLPGERYLALPWLETATSDYRAQLNITRFDGPPEGPVQLNAAWLVFAGEGNSVLATGEAAIAEPLQGTGPAATTEAMSRALAELSRRIATAIQTATRPPSLDPLPPR